MGEINSIELAKRIRINAVKMVHNAHASHIGGVLSCADIMAVLFGGVLRYDSHNPNNPNRDRFVLSKGHSGAALYAVLAECGFFPVKELDNYGKNGGLFSCHVSHHVKGVEMTTGSLGHGVSIACGMAYGAKVDNKDYKIYVLVGDGECNEGAVWEAAMLASHHKLNNLTIIIDHNKQQAMGNCKDIIDMEPLKKKWESFGFKVIQIDGHNHELIKKAFDKKSKKPKVIIADTIKGKGVSFMENELLWHYRDPQGEFYDRAIHELEEKK